MSGADVIEIDIRWMPHSNIVSMGVPPTSGAPAKQQSFKIKNDYRSHYRGVLTANLGRP
jgi:hypothetical protein